MTHPVLVTLADLIRINSVNPNYEGGVPEAAAADYVSRFFRQRGIETWRQEVYPGRPNVLARVEGRNPRRRIVFEAHLDTVATTGMSIDPFDPVTSEGKMFGRGACDTKGGMAAMMHALATVAETPPPCEVLFAATFDEEFSYRGVLALCNSLERGAVDPRVLEQGSAPRHPLQAAAAVVAEPTMLEPVVASKGLVRFKIETTGKAAHSAKPHLGSNAIEQMALVVTAIAEDTKRLARRTHPLLGPATCNIGLVRGGTQVNVVPDRCEVEIDRRLLPGESSDAVLEHYRALVDALAARQSGMRVVVHPPMLTDRPLETDVNGPVLQSMLRLLADLGLSSHPIGVPFCSDASKFGALGIPSIILGPGNIEHAHAAVEYVDCEQVMQATEVYRRFMSELE